MASLVACRILMSYMTGSMRASPSALSHVEEVRRGNLAPIPTIFLSFFCIFSPCVQLCHVTASCPKMISRGRRGGSLSKCKAYWMKYRCISPGAWAALRLSAVSDQHNWFFYFQLWFQCFALYHGVSDWETQLILTRLCLQCSVLFIHALAFVCGTIQNPRWQNTLLFPRISYSSPDLLSSFPEVISIYKGKMCVNGN